jgi:hypothetical protein
MPRHPSNAERIERAAEEAQAWATAKAAKKAATPRRRAPAAPPRMKMVWTVGKPGAEPVHTYAYAEKEAADAEALRRGGDYRVLPLKVPMEDA